MVALKLPQRSPSQDPSEINQRQLGLLVQLGFLKVQHFPLFFVFYKNDATVRPFEVENQTYADDFHPFVQSRNIVEASGISTNYYKHHNYNKHHKLLSTQIFLISYLTSITIISIMGSPPLSDKSKIKENSTKLFLIEGILPLFTI